MRADCSRIGGVHLLMVVAGAAMVSALERRVEETLAVGVRGGVAGGRAAVHAALVPPLLQRARRSATRAALSAHVHVRSPLTHHASLL